MSDWRFPHEVRGWLTPAEGYALAALARGREVLEIGSYEGRSTLCMAQTAARVVALDHHKGDEGTGPADTLEAFLANLDAWGLRGKVEPLVGRVEDVEGGLPDAAFDMVFVDGAHDTPSVGRDLRLALRVLRPGGTLAIHDWNYATVRAGAEACGVVPHGHVDQLAWVAKEG